MTRKSPGKINLLLNILGKRADGFHELETVLHPVAIFDELTISRQANGIHLTCSDPVLPVDSSNLVHRAATVFLSKTQIKDGVRIHLEKRLPLAAGMGGGSGNAAITLLALNELFGAPLSPVDLEQLAGSLGSDVPFFLQSQPALATGRGEKIQPLGSFRALQGSAFFLIHPGFGISTAWAYQALGRYPAALNGKAARAQKLISLLEAGDLRTAGTEFYNSLEAPALEKYPLLALFQEFLRAEGAAATLMSGSGSTTFAVARSLAAGEQLAEKFRSRFGTKCWTAVVPV
jgi:4-diphosphocytidyl-2-C-methyl-D-erythritol kinase